MDPPGPRRTRSSGTPAGEKRDAVRVWLLGGFSVHVGSSTIARDAWRLRKATALVKMLALAPGHGLHREQAMDLLWPDLEKEAASNNLRQAIYAVRRILGSTAGSRYLDSDEGSLVLCPGGGLLVDVEAFEETAAAARRFRDPGAYRVAIGLYAGELLPGDLYEAWAEGRRRELRKLYVALLTELAGLYEERGEFEAAIEGLQKVVAEQATREEAHIIYGCLEEGARRELTVVSAPALRASA